MHITQIIDHTGFFIWPLLVVSLLSWYVAVWRLCGRQRAVVSGTKETLHTLGTVASSIGLVGSAYGLAVTLASLTTLEPAAITATMGTAVCSTIVGTAIAINCAFLGMLVDLRERCRRVQVAA